jgi:MFS family permease
MPDCVFLFLSLFFCFNQGGMTNNQKQGCALALNLPMMIIFMFLSGVAGSTALSNVAGTISDLFGAADNAGQPMALFVMSANTGPSIGSVIGEWIAVNPRMGLNWIFWIK